MPSRTLQTVIVSKNVARTRAKAERLARPHANRIYTSRETGVSWRFRQRPPSDFKKRSFRTFPIPEHPGIALVYGELKASAKKRKSSGSFSYRCNPEPPPLHKGSARSVITTPSGARRQKKVYRGWEDVEIEGPRKRSASEPPDFHRESAYLLLGRNRKAKENPGRRRSKLKPGEQRHLQWKGTEHDSALRDWDFWLAAEPQIKKARSERKLREIATITGERDIKSDVIRSLIYGTIADRARALLVDAVRRGRYETRGKKRFRFLFAPPSPETDEKYVRALVHEKNPGPTPNKAKAKAKTSSSKKKSAKKTKRSSSKKKTNKKSARAKKLKAPRVMPDPGPCAWLGSTLELSFDHRGANPKWTKRGEKGRDIWSCGRREWMFLWSPKYKAVVVIPKPRGLRGGPGCAPGKAGKVIRDGGAALSFERFAARAAEATQEVEIPECNMTKLGKGVHIVYRSDKWSPTRKTTDYIHDYGKDVQIYCGPSVEKPEVFICFGGKLTLTERGLVF